MANGNFHGSFKPKIYREFREIVGPGNIKKSIEEYMSNTINLYKADIGSIDIQILNKEIGQLTHKIAKMQAELSHRQELRDKFQKEKENKERQQLELKKDKLQKAQTCLNCGQIMPDKIKKHQFPKGTVCNGCFISVLPKDVKKWY